MDRNLLITDTLILVILNNLDYIFDEKILNLTQYIVFAWLFISNIALIIGHSNIYSYLYATHPYTLKLKKEQELALKKEETIRKKIKLAEESTKETARIKAIAFENRMRKKIKEKKRIEKQKIEDKLNILLYDKLQTEDGIKSFERFMIGRNKNFSNKEREMWLNLREKELKEQEDALNNSPLTNYFNAVEGGETILYYLKLQNKFGETRYKIGVTLNSV